MFLCFCFNTWLHTAHSGLELTVKPRMVLNLPLYWHWTLDLPAYTSWVVGTQVCAPSAYLVHSIILIAYTFISLSHAVADNGSNRSSWLLRISNQLDSVEAGASCDLSYLCALSVWSLIFRSQRGHHLGEEIDKFSISLVALDVYLVRIFFNTVIYLRLISCLNLPKFGNIWHTSSCLV